MDDISAPILFSVFPVPQAFLHFPGHLRLRKSKTFKLGAFFKKKGKIRQHRRLSYETTNPAVATVNSSGKIKAVGKGTCFVYAYTQNGLFKRVKVTVKK